MRAGMMLPALACALLAGCGALRGVETQPPAPSVRAGSPQPGSSTDALLAYYQQLRRLAGPELAREHEAARVAYARAPRSDASRVRLAMTLSLPNTAFADEPRALELLEPVSRNAGAELSGLAHLLSAHLQERRRLDAHAQALQQKLDALKTLERSLIERKR